MYFKSYKENNEFYALDKMFCLIFVFYIPTIVPTNVPKIGYKLLLGENIKF